MILSTTRVLVAHSKNDGWGDERPAEITKLLDDTIDKLFFDAPGALSDCSMILFAPTGPLQELAMANGWSDPYMMLATEYDSLANILKDKQAEQTAAASPVVGR